MNILLADDTMETRTVFELIFRLEGHSTELASDGSEALQIIEEKASELDVIILDYHMPGMDGLEVVRQMKGRKKGRRVPIILFTGDTRGSLDSEAQTLGVASVARKPILPAELLALAQEAVNAA